MSLVPGQAVLVDTNLLVLYVIGNVNRRRIETFKRTRQYRPEDHDLLLRVLTNFTSVYTLAHIMAEVSNLTDLHQPELLLARRALKEMVKVCHEVPLPSGQAMEERVYERLGLTDAAIACAAREHNCAVLTDYLDLYLNLSRNQTPVYNFTHLRTQHLNLTP